MVGRLGLPPATVRLKCIGFPHAEAKRSIVSGALAEDRFVRSLGASCAPSPESPDQQSRGSTTHMHTQPALTALDIEIQDFAQTLNQCFRGVSWDVVNYYAAHAWSVSDRSDARWPEVRARVRSAWEAGVIGPVFRPLEMALLDRRA